jgi:DMSO/TMAO reductase YedYZ molybdopterin-dependent catalytic subunit
MNCGTKRSKISNTIEGVTFRDFLTLVTLCKGVSRVTIYGHYNGAWFNLSRDNFLSDDALFVYKWKDHLRDWETISAKHSFPRRFISAASFYLWKGTKWVSGMTFLT